MNGNREWWVNLTFACGLVVTDQYGYIIDAMPILHRFIGQHISKLSGWDPYVGRERLR